MKAAPPRPLLLLLLAVLSRCFAHAQAPQPLSIFIQDNHAGSFAWLAKTLDLDKPHTLILIDAHSDASRAEDSDALRDGLRRVPHAEERARRADAWLAAGRVQAFNWIEPLMPLPFSRVYWWQDAEQDPSTLKKMELEARGHLDANLDHLPRLTGPLSERFRCVQDPKLTILAEHNEPIIATIDLDTFAAHDPATATARFHHMWQRLLRLGNLRAVTFSISRPWLQDDAQAHAYTEMALQAALSVDQAKIYFEPFAPEGPDDSLEAEKFRRKGEPPPRYQLTSAPESLRQLACQHRHRLRVQHQPAAWASLLDTWSSETPEWHIKLPGLSVSVDDVWRLSASTEAPLTIVSRGSRISPTRVRWLEVRPAESVFNALPNFTAGKVFADCVPSMVRVERREITTTTEATLPASIWKKLADPATGWGTVRITAEVEWKEDNTIHHATVPEVQLRLRATDATGFRAALSEGFNRPYIFGVGLLPGGADTSCGNDCANFLVTAWRRTGRALPWCSPAQLRRWLIPVGKESTLEKPVPINEKEIAAGLIVDLGSHVAAVWKDQGTQGLLDSADLVVHHLSGKPECIPLGQLMRDRPASFALRRAPLFTRDCLHHGLWRRRYPHSSNTRTGSP